MEVEAEDKEVVEISVDSVLGELQSVLKGKITESDSSSDSEEEEDPIKNGLSTEDAQEQCNKTDEEKIVENSSGSPVSPSSYVERPIFFKSSIKKDPGSKLHDQLVKELGSVLKKRSQQNGDLDPVKEEEKKVKDDSNNKKPGPLKANSVFANKALLAHLENHLQKSLHKTTVAGKPRSSVNDSSFENKPNDLPDIMESSISGAAQFGVKLRPTQKRAQKAENPVISAGISSTSSPQLHQESSQSDILLQAKASLTGTKVQQPSKSLTVKTDKNIIVPTVYSYREKTVTINNTNKPPSVELLKLHDNKVPKHTSVKTDDNVFHVSTLKKEGRHLTQINISGAVSCPVIHTIDEGGMPSASGPGLYKGLEDKETVFYVEMGKRSGGLDIKVEGPNSIAKTTVERAGDKSVVQYIPVEVGIFNISIMWNGQHIPGSPFHPKVIDPRKVRISGGWAQYMDGNERVGLVVGEEKRLVFDVSQAGPGTLKAEVVGPGSSLPVSLSDNYGQMMVGFIPREEGNHYIHLYWSDVALPNSPFLGYAVPTFSDANKVILTGRGLKEAIVREEAEFIIDGSQAGPEYHQNRAPEVSLTGVRAEINVKVVSLGGGKHRCTYIPVVPGAYLLNITWNGRQLRGSPYKVNVIGTFYPQKVSVSGEGLRGGILGRPMDVAIDTRRAGPGELTAFCMGPSKASYCELKDNHDGTFVLKVKAQEPGRHVLQIKYGGEHVNGSPFQLKVGAQPDASKVRVTGPGVEHGILATYQSRFIVETRGAGAGQLTVRIRGPKGGFQVEMYRDSQRDRTILCRYDPTETGLYVVSVRWSGVDVPGSPFQINIVDTQQELEQVLHDASFAQSSVTHRSFSQWREDI